MLERYEILHQSELKQIYLYLNRHVKGNRTEWNGIKQNSLTIGLIQWISIRLMLIFRYRSDLDANYR